MVKMTVHVIYPGRTDSTTKELTFSKQVIVVSPVVPGRSRGAARGDRCCSGGDDAAVAAASRLDADPRRLLERSVRRLEELMRQRVAHELGP